MAKIKSCVPQSLGTEQRKGMVGDSSAEVAVAAGTGGSAGFAEAVLAGCKQDTEAGMVHGLH